MVSVLSLWFLHPGFDPRRAQFYFSIKNILFFNKINWLKGHWNVPAIQTTEWWLKCDWNPPFPLPFSRHSATIRSPFSRLKGEISSCEYLHIWNIKYKVKRNLFYINMKINWYFKPSMPLHLYFIVGKAGFIHHGRMISYNLWRHILHTHSKSRLYVLQTDCTFFLFYSSFKWIQGRQNIYVKKVYLFTFILDTGLNSHARDLYKDSV